MDLTDFNCNYLNQLLQNISKERKFVFLLGDFNVNLLNYNEHNQTNEFLDSLASNLYIPLILQQTRITSHSNTLIDNIFSNAIDPDIISSNLTTTIRVSQLGSTSGEGGNLDKMAKNCMKMTKSTFWGQNSEGDMGGQANFSH